MTRLWIVRLGKYGEYEGRALETGELATGWSIRDLRTATTREAVLAALQEAEPQEKLGTLQNWAAQLNQLRNVMAAGDLVVTPLKTTGQLAIGRVVGDYLHFDDKHPGRKVEWLRKDVAREAVRQDLLFSLGASQTVCEVSRNEAAARFEVIASTGRDPGIAVSSTDQKALPGSADSDTSDPRISLTDVARDQIVQRLATNFSGHEFTQLIAAILRAQGYQARVTPPGADRGIDIVAGQGALGFDGPRLVVQVKSGSVVADQPTLQSLLGCIQDTQAEHGLLVSWSGFTSAVRQRVNELYFRVRLWGREEILDALFSVYEELPEDIRAELPLQKLWVLVPEPSVE